MSTQDGHRLISLQELKMKEGWEQVSIDKSNVFRRRQYSDYDQYVLSQSAKLNSKEGWCRKVDHNNQVCLSLVLHKERITRPGMSVLCLAARLGGEVQTFKGVGCFAVGIDVNPGKGNKDVIHGDFHDIQFADSSLHLVYLNCIDHAVDPYKVFSEIHRILKPNGIFHFETENGYMEKTADGSEYKMSDRFDCLEWAFRKDVISEIAKAGFVLEREYQFPKAKAHPYGYILRRCVNG